MIIRFRTQDTKANWARKLNLLLTPARIDRFRETPQTLAQWQIQLNATVAELRADDYVLADLTFRTSDTRQLFARKLNLLSAAVEAGPV